ncbi:MAG: hypothetical protein U9O87_11215 [Verrucomicrobiota bacterium]|nr:hypothetical protein [Verrucomicrobiota bacterium]
MNKKIIITIIVIIILISFLLILKKESSNCPQFNPDIETKRNTEKKNKEYSKNEPFKNISKEETVHKKTKSKDKKVEGKRKDSSVEENYELKRIKEIKAKQEVLTEKSKIRVYMPKIDQIGNLKLSNKIIKFKESMSKAIEEANELLSKKNLEIKEWNLARFSNHTEGKTRFYIRYYHDLSIHKFSKRVYYTENHKTENHIKGYEIQFNDNGIFKHFWRRGKTEAFFYNKEEKHWKYVNETKKDKKKIIKVVAWDNEGKIILGKKN